MTHSRSYTSATLDASGNAVKPKLALSASTWWRILFFATILLGAALRLLRLSWQPLWWDEGYSIYFATEPFATMLDLTALDIHPPLYYALLHIWFVLTGSTGPETARLFSVLVGIVTLPVIAWTSLALLPAKRWLALFVTLLLAVNPFHLYYSQEVRMYGLAMLLTLASSTFLWRMQKRLEQDQQPFAQAAGYVITASLALLTLYYTGFLLLAHQLWALATNRTQWRWTKWFLAAALLTILANLPWWLYALPKLFTYISNKVLSDQDQSLSLWTYVARHWVAFFAGHLHSVDPLLEVARQVIAVLIALVTVAAIILQKKTKSMMGWLATLILVPSVIGFVINLVYPFFPEGGERLLLPLLPYALLLYAIICVNFSTTNRHLMAVVISLPLIAAIIGIYIFFSTPRYTEHDYRPIVAEVVTNSRPTDSVLALFPWQVGYWRAYTPRTDDGMLLPPQPAPVDQTILRWDELFASRLDHELENGTIWFPMPLSFGSTLPGQIEEYLQLHARNLENHWYSAATRLTAWVQLEETAQLQPVGATFSEQVTLASSGVAPSITSSANNPLAVDLCWQPPFPRDDLRSTLRLLDASGTMWANRDLTPLAHYVSPNPDKQCLESVAFNIPIGMPPNTYQLAIGVGPEDSEHLFNNSATSQPLTAIGQISITPPGELISPLRLPIDHRLSPPFGDQGMLLLGNSGPSSDAPILAGDEVALLLYLQATELQPSDREIYLSLLDRNGDGLAGWQGWPLPTYPPHNWSNGALAYAPITFYLPPDIAEGGYTLVAGFFDPGRGEKSEPATLAQLQVVRRPISFDRPPYTYPVAPPATFGTHASLIGYDLSQNGSELQIKLTWQILQTLLPPHHIFVHLFNAAGQRVAQDDGEPVTGTGRAPSGSWIKGEILTTQHMLEVPSGQTAPLTIQTGLYLPVTGIRLPVTIDGVTVGDSATITVTSIVTR